MSSWGQVTAAITQAGVTSGLNQDAINAAIAVSQSEGGGTTNAGDGGTSFGPFQLHIGGQLNNFASWLGGADLGNWLAGFFGPVEQKAYDPYLAATFALRPGGYLYNTLLQGQAKGLKGPDLAYYLSQYGQVSAYPQSAANAFIDLFGGAQVTTGTGKTPPPITLPTIAPPPTIVPKVNIAADPLTAIANAVTSIAAFPAILTAGINDLVSFGQWLGQPHIVLRLTLGLIGVILIMLGLGLFGYSFVPQQVKTAAGDAVKAVAA